LYTGTIIDDQGKDKKITIDFEPFKPLNTSLYYCDNKFHTDALNCLLDDENVFGFIIVDGNGCLIATLSGNKKTILRKFTVELPGKTRRGGQSANRFARLREDARRNYIRKVSENANELFITNNEKVNVKGIVIAGSADLKNDLTISDVFDERIKKSIISVVDISYGQLNGLNQAIELSSKSLSNLKFIKEKKLLQEYFEEISSVSSDNGKYCCGLKDTIKCLTELNLIETLIIYEELNTEIYITDSNKDEISLTSNNGEKTAILLTEWLCENYTKFGIKLEFVSDSTQEGSQFVKGFGGIGGILRYTSPINLIDNYEDEDW
jgi:peptide chain release factor subunit 1